MRTNANACDCAQGCTDIVRESALKVDSGGGGEISCRTGESNLPRRRAGPMRYQLSYIPTPTLAHRETRAHGERGSGGYNGLETDLGH